MKEKVKRKPSQESKISRLTYINEKVNVASGLALTFFLLNSMSTVMSESGSSEIPYIAGCVVCGGSAIYESIKFLYTGAFDE